MKNNIRRRFRHVYLWWQRVVLPLLNEEHAGHLYFPGFTDDNWESEIKRQFQEFCDTQVNDIATFPDLLKELSGVNDLMGKSKEDKVKRKMFCRKTQLSDKLFRDCAKNTDVKPEMYTLLSIAIGLQLDDVQIEKLLRSAGKILLPTGKVNKAYLFVLNKIRTEDFTKCLREDGDAIFICNYILDALGFEAKDTLGRH